MVELTSRINRLAELPEVELTGADCNVILIFLLFVTCIDKKGCTIHIFVDLLCFETNVILQILKIETFFSLQPYNDPFLPKAAIPSVLHGLT